MNKRIRYCVQCKENGRKRIRQAKYHVNGMVHGQPYSADLCRPCYKAICYGKLCDDEGIHILLARYIPVKRK